MEEHSLFGYAGKILIVDLESGRTRTEQLNMDYAKKYIGGIGLGMRLWLDNTKQCVDPLSPENTLVLALGPVSGTMFPTGGNGHAFISKSPETFARWRSSFTRHFWRGTETCRLRRHNPEGQSRKTSLPVD